MEAYRVEAIVQENGTVTVKGLPLAPGQGVEVIVLSQAQTPPSIAPYPLRDTPVTYLDPTEPAAAEDWESAS